MAQEVAVPLPTPVATARCFGCHNRVGLAGLVILECGVVCCRRCWDQRELLPVPGREISVEVVG